MWNKNELDVAERIVQAMSDAIVLGSRSTGPQEPDEDTGGNEMKELPIIMSAESVQAILMNARP